MYGPYLTMDQIKAQYPNEWVFLAKPTTDRSQHVTGGHVIAHHTSRAEFLRLVGEAPEMPEVRMFASQWTGDMYGRDEDALEPETGAA
jgi:hypothetical protein